MPRDPSGATRRALVLAVLLLPGLACAQESGAAQDPEAALRAGRYDEAIAGYRQRLSAGETGDARLGLADALTAVGRYDEAEKTLREGDHPRAGLPLGRILIRQGRLDEARTVLEAVAADGPDALEARYWTGWIDLRQGDREAALDRFDTFIDAYNGAPSLTGRDLMAVGHAVRHLGVRDPGLFQDALRAYDEALAADATLDEARVAIGTLFLEKHNSGEAKGALQQVVARNPRHPEANLALARAARFDGSREALTLTDSALAVNPNLAPARAFRALLLLELGDRDGAVEEAERALEVDSRSLEALSARATARLLARDDAGFARDEAEILSLNPAYADLYSTAAELLSQQRQYAMAAEMAARGVALSPDDATARGHLALNQLRTGEVADGKVNLEEAFEDDPHNVWYYNTLQLLDDLETFRVLSHGDFTLVLHEREADLLAPYVGAYAQEALDVLSARYGTRPPTPIRLEVFPSHQDFSVRTVGLAGLGALGVSFGSVLAMDSPSARDVGAFNWASTLWHEVAHSVHMGISEHRVPRWFTEGCAVHEQRRARDGWGDPVSPTFVAAIRDDHLHPVSRLNEGFVRPSYPEHVSHSYFQASLVCEWLEDQHGFQAIRTFLDGYRDGATSEALFREVTGQDMQTVDEAFDRHMRTLFAAALESTAPVRGPDGEDAEQDPFRREMRRGIQAFESGDLETARDAFSTAVSLFPQYGGQDGPHRYLARIAEARGDVEGALAEWRVQFNLNENDLDAAEQIARLEEERGNAATAAGALSRVIEIAPYAPELHERLAALYEAAGDTDGMVRERSALLALAPVDRAEALYELARAHFMAGDRDVARRRVVEALEIAPGYSDALDLLLRIREAGA